MFSTSNKVNLYFVPLVACLLVISLQAFLIGYKAPVADALGYADRATTFSFIPSGAAQESGIIFAPLYPAFLSLMMSIDTGVEQAVQCYVARDGGCDVSGLAPVYVVQTILIALEVYFCYLVCLFLTKRVWISLSVMVLVLLAGRMSEYATWLITETWAFFGFMGFATSLAYALKVKDNSVVFLLMGLGLSIAVLTRPSYLYLVYFLILAIPFYWLVIKKEKPKELLFKTGIFLLPFILFVIPWMLRNYSYYGVFGVSAGYGPHILSERVTYNMMSWTEYAVSFIYWLPDFGDSLSKSLFPAEFYQKLDFGYPEGYYAYGNSIMRAEIYEQAATEKERISLLLNGYILPDIVKHIMVTLSLSLRGMWVAKYFGLIGVLALIPGFIQLKKMAGTAPVLFFAFPFFFMVGFNAFVSVSIPRYNVPLVMIYAIAIVLTAWSIWKLVQPLLVRRGSNKN
ncbi:hypothetical protein [Kiloniella majae]|uniref:hypothetical protein n=1 Tax=Kiloniella majae TaxID=1938558 RepID=UPI000A277DAD|nr:hypothetical protein [Kiloniella majae]